MPSSFVCVGGSMSVEGVDCDVWVSPICVGGCSVGGVLSSPWVSPILVGGVVLSLVFVCGSVGVMSSLWVSPIVMGGGRFSCRGIIVIGV